MMRKIEPNYREVSAEAICPQTGEVCDVLRDLLEQAGQCEARADASINLLQTSELSRVQYDEEGDWAGLQEFMAKKLGKKALDISRRCRGGPRQVHGGMFRRESSESGRCGGVGVIAVLASCFRDKSVSDSKAVTE